MFLFPLRCTTSSMAFHFTFVAILFLRPISITAVTAKGKAGSLFSLVAFVFEVAGYLKTLYRSGRFAHFDLCWREGIRTNLHSRLVCVVWLRLLNTTPE